MRMRRPGTTKDYILKRDRESETATVFTLQGLTWKQLDEVNMQSAMSMEQALQVQEIYQLANDEDRELTDEELGQVQEISPMDANMMHRLNQQHATACQYGLVKIDDVFDEEGKPFTLTPAEFVEATHGVDLRELGTEIISMSRYNEAELKN